MTSKKIIRVGYSSDENQYPFLFYGENIDDFGKIYKPGVCKIVPVARKRDHVNNKDGSVHVVDCCKKLKIEGAIVNTSTLQEVRHLRDLS